MQAAIVKHGFSATRTPKLPMDRAELAQAVTSGVKKRPSRIPDPPPRPSKTVAVTAKTVAGQVPSPLPPPPPPPGAAKACSLHPPPPPPPGAPKARSLHPPPPPPPGAATVPSALPSPPSPPGAAKVHSALPSPPQPSFSKVPANLAKSASRLRRAPQVIELYNSLMKRESRKDPLSNGGASESAGIKNARDNMIDELATRSSHYHAVKDDVETQGDFVKALIEEVNDAVYPTIEDVVAFVKWLDNELSHLVDERAVLKHFEWPEVKSDALREAAFGYLDLKKLETEVASFKDDPTIPIDVALKKMETLAEKTEHILYNFLRMRDKLLRQCKEFQIPTSWLLDKGMPSEIKLASVKLARIYLKRVISRLEAMDASGKVSKMGHLLLQSVRFAYKIHQFAGGFDAETINVFEELRNFINIHFKPSS